MSLAEEYSRQFAWRNWETALAACPIVAGQKVLDLGCGPGDIAAELTKRGVQVIGIDTSEELLAVARSRNLKSCVFHNQNLKSLQLRVGSFDGIWCSFTAAYFPDFKSVLSGWLPFLKQKAWICVTEIDDLFGHEPTSERSRRRLDEFYNDSIESGRYDFCAGHKLSGVIKSAGFEIQERLLSDRELAFDGVAEPAVVRAWMNRFDRMRSLKNFLGDEFEDFKSDFLSTLATNEHRSKCRVFSVVGTRN